MRCDAQCLVLVTGGASGLGSATAMHFAELGCRVVVLDLAGESTLPMVHCDVTDAAAVAKAIETIVADHGVPRVLVNCAGIAPASRTVSRSGPHDTDLFTKVIAVNLIGSFTVAAQLASHMVANEPLADGERGVIVNTASVAAFDGQVGQCAYAASKAGVAGMTLPMARDLASLGVRVCAIAPGIFATPMVTAMPDDIQQSLAQQIPFPKRLGAPHEFAQLVQHIAENSMLNGEVIRLDGAIRMGAK